MWVAIRRNVLYLFFRNDLLRKYNYAGGRHTASHDCGLSSLAVLNIANALPVPCHTCIYIMMEMMSMMIMRLV